MKHSAALLTAGVMIFIIKVTHDYYANIFLRGVRADLQAHMMVLPPFSITPHTTETKNTTRYTTDSAHTIPRR